RLVRRRRHRWTRKGSDAANDGKRAMTDGTTSVSRDSVSRERDTNLRERANKVIPGGMYGHLSARRLPPHYPQFYERVQGARAWDVDGREFVDMMCSFGPMILGYQHEKVEQAA